MKLQFDHKQERQSGGIALIMVLMVITVLGVIAFGFAKAMSVEVKLARNASFDTETEWMGRSGVETARFLLGNHLTIANEGVYDFTNQFWAGGWRATNENTEGLDLQHIPIGQGEISVAIIDLERYFNINLATDAELRTAMEIIGVDATQTAEIVDAILDWRDTDDNPLLNGAESDYYLSLSPPYMPKNGPIDDLEELLQIKGITPEMFYGPNATNGGGALPSGGRVGAPGSRQQQEVAPPVGLKDLFTPISAGWVNKNTSSAYVQQLIGWDPSSAEQIILGRLGPDQVPATGIADDDDTPYESGTDMGRAQVDPNGLRTTAGKNRQNSATFQATITVRLNNKERQMVAIIRRSSAVDVRVLMQYWK